MTKNPLFWIFLAVKLACFALVPASVVTELFVPFLDAAVKNIGQNPWELLPPNYFPYGSVLFFVVFVPKALLYLVFQDAALANHFLSFAALRLPILAADIYFLHLLLSFPGLRADRIYWFYWCNPVLIFINYVHVQLDIFAVLFVFVSLKFMLEEKILPSALAFSAAILCKFHVAILAPLMLAYLWNTKFKKQAVPLLALWTVGVLGAVGMGFLPHLLSSQFHYVSVQSPEALKVFSLAFKLDGQNELYIGFGLVVAALARLVLSSRITKQGLVYASAILLGALLLTTSAMPGWYFWIYPFLALFLTQYSTRLQPVIVASFVFYAVKFFPEYFGFEIPGLISTVSFTLLQMSLFGMLVGIWLFVIKTEMPWLRRSRPLLVGIAGDSGAGKNTLSQTLFDLFGNEATSVIEGDDYHKWDRGHEKWQEYTHLNPRANYLETLSSHVVSLMRGQSIYKTHYDHSMGRFTDAQLVAAQKNIIVQGLHTFYPIVLRNIMDIKIFIAPQESLRKYWKIKRDHADRGHNLARIVSTMKEREVDAAAHINPQRNYSDWVLEYVPYRHNLMDLDAAEHLSGVIFKGDPEFYQVHHLVNDTPVEMLIEALRKIKTLSVHCENSGNVMNFLKLKVEGHISAAQVEEVATQVFGTLRHLTRSSRPPVWHGGYEGINQLVFLSMVLRSEFSPHKGSSFDLH